MAEIASTTFSQTDASNTGSLPGLSGSSSPALIDNSIRAMMGATKREHDWRNYTVTSGGSANAYTLTYSVAPDAYYTGQRFAFKTSFANTGAATVNVNALGAKTIKKLSSGAKADVASGDINSGDYIDLVYDGTDFVWVNKGATTVSSASDTTAGIVELATNAETLTGTDATRATTPDSVAALWEQGSDVASAGTVTLGDGGYFNITGTTTITDIDFTTDKAGRRAWLKFAGALTLTHNATTLILPTGANITTAAGDTAEFVSEGSDVVRCVSYQRADGSSLSTSSIYTLIQTLTTTSGSTASVTGISSAYRELYIEVAGVSFSGTATLQIAVSDDNGTNYGTAVSLNPTTGAAARSVHGTIRVSNLQATDAYVVAASWMGLDNNPGAALTASTALLAESGGSFGPMNAIRFSPSSGTFDAGTIRVYGIR